MIALLQRVTAARVDINGERQAAIERGILALVCAERGDGQREAVALAEKTLAFRMFQDHSERMNLNLIEAHGRLLAVPQFTLAADTGRGRRPSFTKGAEPELAYALFQDYVRSAEMRLGSVEVGVFGANMQVSLTNDGPVTFWLRVAPSDEEKKR
jgi:D-tyrosyl-tRNA(Tyr) deacylase